MIQTLLQLDASISQFISQLVPHNQFYDSFFEFLSLKGTYLFVWIAMFIFLYFYEKKKHIHFVLLFIASLTITLLLVEYILKPTFHRSRPYIVQNIDTSYCPRTFSFPSGHAAGAFAGATILAHYDRKRRRLYFITASLISLSRIYLLCHFLVDITCGALIGYIISKAIINFTSYNNKSTKTKIN